VARASSIGPLRTEALGAGDALLVGDTSERERLGLREDDPKSWRARNAHGEPGSIAIDLAQDGQAAVSM
jgi:hypothetical protein